MIRNLFKRKKNKSKAQPSASSSSPEEKNKELFFKAVTPLPSPEKLCEIDPETMDKKAISAHLKILYKRHNEAASSLNKELRNEAETMLDAIVECRSKYVDS
ncbi:MAG: hypothetical protein QM496_11355 [Verrucomicrobiota bacterium]